MIWILFTVGAVCFQTLRNAMQSQLSGSVDVLGVTLSRFLLAPPIACVYLLLVSHVEHVDLYVVSHSVTFDFIAIVILAALFQIAATSLMVTLFKQKNFAIGAGLAKSEALVAGVLGTLFFSSYLSPLGWLGIIVGAIAVIILSVGKHAHTKRISARTLLLGLACGVCFASTSLLVREATLLLNISTLVAAAWTLIWVLGLQSFGLVIFLAIKKPNVLRQLLLHWKRVVLISVLSCLGSICIFTAVALEQVAYVKTLAQLEVLLTLLVSHYLLNDKVTKREIVGSLMIGIAAIMVMWV
ncbi:EamA family transporter [Alteromonas sp. A079]|uniref:EamA family transporter n=1 Tax=Alteromonas sp. A079 TaxID=3410268 RepID=UPI003B9E6EBC